MRKFSNLLLVILTLMLFFCLETPCFALLYLDSVSADSTIKETAPVGEIYEVNTGDSFLAQFLFKKVKSYTMSQGITSKMPGGYGFSIKFSIQQSTLNYDYEDANYIYYAAPFKNIQARSVLGNIIVQGDSAGIRVNKDNDIKEWYLDNSQWNKCDDYYVAVWTRQVKETDGVVFEEKELPLVNTPIATVKIVFNGYSGSNEKMLHFTLVETISEHINLNRRIDEQVKATEFHFNFDSNGGSTIVAFRNMILEVLEVNNVSMKYRWVKF